MESDMSQKKENIESFLPEVNFETLDIDIEVKIFLWLSSSKHFQNIFNKTYPDLFLQLNKSKNKEERIKLCKDFIEKKRILDKEIISGVKKELQLEWGKLEKDFLKELSEHFETNWPEDKPKITAYITNSPISPRFLDDYSFATGYWRDISRIIETIAHETVHFLWFKKFKEVFPEIKNSEYESPHLAWRLSEIIDPIILHCNLKINGLIKPIRWGYDSFKNIKIGDVSMIEYFKKIYLDSINNGDNFEETVKKLWTEAQTHEKEINNF